MSYSEKRNADRVDRRESVSIQILSSSVSKELPAVVLDSETLDISAGGVRIHVDQAVEVGSILDFCVEFQDNPRRFLLTGEIKWCKKVDKEGVFFIGIEILDAEGTDIEPWNKVFVTDKVE